MSDEDKDYERVRNDHYLSLAAMFLAAAYAWQIHGFWIGLFALVGIWLATSTTNIIILRRVADDADPDGVFRTMRRFRWGWIILAFVLIALTGAEFSPNT